MDLFSKNRIGKITVLIIGGIILFTLLFVLSFYNGAYAFATENKSFGAAKPDRMYIDEKFEDDSVIVVLDSKISHIDIHNVKCFEGIELESITDLTKRKKNKSSKNTGFRQILQIHLKEKSKENVIKTIEHLEKLEGVLSAEPNYIFDVAIDSDDPEYMSGNLWGLNGANGINVSDAWNISRGNNTVRVGIIDTGIANHADLNANLVTGRDTFNNNDITNDDTHSHGTHVAGTVGAVGNNSLGVVGVNWNVSLVPLQAANASNAFSVANVVAAIEWAQDRWGTDEQISILNYSVSGLGRTTAVRTAISEYNGLFVWAAGNDTADIDVRVSANGSFNLDNLISVGAINVDGTRRLTSNYSTNNTNVNIYAPGTNIYSTVPTWYASSGYGYKSGTSMAAPHVTGVAALMLSINPNMAGETGTTLGARLKHAIVNNADTISITIPNGSGGTISQNVKKLNAFKAASSVAFTTETVASGVSITGLRAGYMMANNTNLILPEKFAPLGTMAQKTIVAIGNNAFENITQLSKITIPINVTRIGWAAFSPSTVLIRYDGDRADKNLIVVDGTKDAYLTSGWNDFNIVEMSSVDHLKITSGQLKGAVDIPISFNNRTITSIAPDGFKNQTLLTEVTIPPTVTTIAKSAFEGCSNLERVTMTSSNNLLNFPNQTLSYTNYYYTEHCLNVNLEPDTVYTLSFEYIGLTSTGNTTDVFTSLGVGQNSFASDLPFTKAFTNTGGTQTITFIPTAEQLSSSNKLWCRFIRTSSPATVSVQVKNVLLEKGVTYIAIDAFRGCQYLASPGLEYSTSSTDGTQSVSQGSFDSCVLFIPKKIYKDHTYKYVTTIAASGFVNNKKIKWVFTQQGLTTIGDRAFQFCSNIIKVDLQQTSVTIIEEYTFDVCAMHNDHPNHVHNPHSEIYDSRCMIDEIAFPPNLTEIKEGAFIRTGIPTGNNLPDTVTSIGAYACSDSLRLGLRLPNSLQTIGEHAFENCGNIILGNIDGTQLTGIGAYAFKDTHLITIDHLPVSLETIGAEAFNGTMFSQDFVLRTNGALNEIGNGAFSSTNIKRIIITNTVTTMGANVFSGNDEITIYTTCESKPSGWHSNWNSSNRPVFWKCTLSSDKTYVVSFKKKVGNPSNINATNGISDPFRDGYNFNGWYTLDNNNNKVYHSDLSSINNDDTVYADWVKKSCVAEGTLITLADGSQVAVEDLTGEENLLVWNMLTGEYDAAPILFIDSDPSMIYEVIELTFSDGTVVKVIDEHAFFDMTTGEYVFLRNDAAQYIGHYFNKQGPNGTWTSVQLTGVNVYGEVTTAWSPVTYGHLCYYVNGMLSMPGATEGFINIFEVDTSLMQYDEDLMEEDILTYGLYTYEEFNAIIPLPELVFEAFNGQYLKVSIGKGLITLDEIAALLNRYAVFFN